MNAFTLPELNPNETARLQCALNTAADVLAGLTCQPCFQAGPHELNAAGEFLESILDEVNTARDALDTRVAATMKPETATKDPPKPHHDFAIAFAAWARAEAERANLETMTGLEEDAFDRIVGAAHVKRRAAIRAIIEAPAQSELQLWRKYEVVEAIARDASWIPEDGEPLPALLAGFRADAQRLALGEGWSKSPEPEEPEICEAV